MSVILETSKGDIVIDLFTESCPKASQNFLKLCQIKYFNQCIFHNVQHNFLVQTGDPTKTGKGGESIYGLLYGSQARFFDDEIVPSLKHKEKGVVGMASRGENQNASQFYITTAANLHSLDGKYTVFGQVAEGLDVLEAINEMPCDEDGRPLQNVRIRHTVVLDDPTPALPKLEDMYATVIEASPEPHISEDPSRLEDDWDPDAVKDEADSRAAYERQQDQEAHNRAAVLEMIGDLPEADAAPPPNVLFICKLNPVTEEEDLEIIFSRFGAIVSCDIIRDSKTGESLCYGFIGFEKESSCEEAFFKMNNVLIDDRRIKVDFSQSVAGLWKNFKTDGKMSRKGDFSDVRDIEVNPRRSRMQLKAKHDEHGGHRGRGGTRGYEYVFEDDSRHEHRQNDDDRHPASRKKQRR
jgi:peptidyl-prolyl cis-trans isomerase-like 4